MTDKPVTFEETWRQSELGADSFIDKAMAEDMWITAQRRAHNAREAEIALTPPLIDLRDKLRLVEARQKEAVWWAGTDWNRPIHQSNRLAELDSEASALRQQIAEWEK